ncbi:BON domain-containing protein [Flavobacterium luteum]|uniref:BON domain-containing protein n=1 Tax=Flavobacterium luteum TaxID=2026654 RepID=A0A7J5AJD3_9FLAO|nr:BON domain-containing protein [Flavobacterium luteum]KAB1157610.1 BON domain-containing protein [Flavobacterium luteum]
MKTNEQLQKDVLDALKWEPQLHAAEIGVTAKDGIVSLSGTVNNYGKKIAAEKAAKNVAGVRAIVEKIEVTYPNSGVKTDEEIANNVLKALLNNWNVPDEKIKVEVEDSWVTLTGEVSWNYEKEAAKNSIDNIPGVRGVINNIKVKSVLKNELEKKLIEKALHRHSSINANNIHVEVSGTKVILSGKVKSMYQKEEAGKIAWKTPGVWSVENNIVVEYDYEYAI